MEDSKIHLWRKNKFVASSTTNRTDTAAALLFVYVTFKLKLLFNNFKIIAKCIWPHTHEYLYTTAARRDAATTKTKTKTKTRSNNNNSRNKNRKDFILKCLGTDGCHCVPYSIVISNVIHMYATILSLVYPIVHCYFWIPTHVKTIDVNVDDDDDDGFQFLQCTYTAIDNFLAA